jgi:hypothetical protein
MLCATLLFAAARADGQTSAGARTADSVFARARQLVVNGNGAAGRVLVDSMVAASEPDTPGYAEALYWRASLAASSEDAERDYRRIVVEYPTSPRAAESLYKLAQLESTRGDRAAAETHLDRLLSEYPTFADRTPAGVLLVRLAFDANDFARGCPALRQTIGGVPASNVELRNQLEYYLPRCNAYESQRASAQNAAPAETTSKAKPTERGDSAKHESKGAFSLQVAAYAAKSDATALVKKLVARGYDARVVGAAKPFRVRIGHYATRSDATAAAKKLAGKKIETKVVEVGADDR